MSSLNNFVSATLSNIMHINCRSLSGCFTELNILLGLLPQPLVALAVTETWLDHSNHDLVGIKGYNFISQPRASGGSGGGVGLYLRDDLTYTLLNNLCINLAHIECIFAEVCMPGLINSNIVIGCVYRPPASDFTQFNSNISSLLGLLETGNSKSMTVIMAGDFNIDLIKTGSHGPSDEFANNLLSHTFLPTISVPTRIAEFSATLIDNIFVRSSRHNVTKSAAIYSDI